MNTEQIKEVLVSRGYSERNAAIVSNELKNVSEELITILELWLEDEKCQNDYSVQSHSIQQLLGQGMKFPAAVLTMDWLIKDPKAAIRSLTKGTK